MGKPGWLANRLRFLGRSWAAVAAIKMILTQEIVLLLFLPHSRRASPRAAAIVPAASSRGTDRNGLPFQIRLRKESHRMKWVLFLARQRRIADRRGLREPATLRLLSARYRRPRGRRLAPQYPAVAAPPQYYAQPAAPVAQAAPADNPTGGVRGTATGYAAPQQRVRAPQQLIGASTGLCPVRAPANKPSTVSLDARPRRLRYAGPAASAGCIFGRRGL